MKQIKPYLLVEESIFFPKDGTEEIDGLLLGYIIDIMQKYDTLLLKINIGHSRISDTRKMILTNIFIPLRICPIFVDIDSPIHISPDIDIHILRSEDPKTRIVKDIIVNRCNNENDEGCYEPFFFKSSNRFYISKMTEISKFLDKLYS